MNSDYFQNNEISIFLKLKLTQFYHQHQKTVIENSDKMDLVKHEELQKNSDEEMLQDIVNKTDKIHVSFLFWGPLTDLLKELSLHLYATPQSLRYNGWVELGVKIGLDVKIVKSIEYTRIIEKDPVYVMLLAYSGNNDSTIAKIYTALFELERKDIVRQTYPTVLEFHKRISLQFKIPNDEILRPPQMPEIPYIFEKNKPTAITTTKPNRQTKHFEKIVLLTYVPEKNGNGLVKKVVEEFRKELNGKSIGVLMLEEHRKKVLSDPKIVHEFYRSARYIIPIITTDYLTHISENNISTDNLDGKYASFIYSKMMFDYLNKGCKNKKVRCIIPDDDFENVQNHIFFQPLFQAWTKESDIATMAKHILNGQI